MCRTWGLEGFKFSEFKFWDLEIWDIKFNVSMWEGIRILNNEANKLSRFGKGVVITYPLNWSQTKMMGNDKMMGNETMMGNEKMMGNDKVMRNEKMWVITRWSVMGTWWLMRRWLLRMGRKLTRSFSSGQGLALWSLWRSNSPLAMRSFPPIYTGTLLKFSLDLRQWLQLPSQQGGPTNITKNSMGTVIREIYYIARFLNAKHHACIRVLLDTDRKLQRCQLSSAEKSL